MNSNWGYRNPYEHDDPDGLDPHEDEDQPNDEDAPVPLDALDEAPLIDENVRQRLLERC